MSWAQCIWSVARCTAPLGRELRPVGETEFFAGQAALAASETYSTTRVGAGIVSTLDPLLGARAELVLDEHCRLRNFRGVRTPIPDKRKQPAEHAAFRELLAVLQRRGLIYEQNLCTEPHLLALARDFPRLKIVLCHCTGFADATATEAQAWRDAIEALSCCPNVVAKVGGAGSPHRGFGLEKRAVPVGSAELAALTLPYHGQVIQCFGPGRCMFETNYPADKQSFSYGVCWNAFKRVAASLSLTHEETQAVCGGTATAVYGLHDLPIHGRATAHGGSVQAVAIAAGGRAGFATLSWRRRHHSRM